MFRDKGEKNFDNCRHRTTELRRLEGHVVAAALVCPLVEDRDSEVEVQAYSLAGGEKMYHQARVNYGHYADPAAAEVDRRGILAEIDALSRLAAGTVIGPGSAGS